MKICAIDLGKVRTGVACCDAGEMLASPVTVLRQPNREKLLDEITATITELKAQAVVVGHPLNMDGTRGESALAAEEFAEKVQERTGLPVALWDERGTTVTAHNFLNATDTRGQKRKAVVDAVSAVIILQSYMDYRRNHPEA